MIVYVKRLLKPSNKCLSVLSKNGGNILVGHDVQMLPYESIRKHVKKAVPNLY